MLAKNHQPDQVEAPGPRRPLPSANATSAVPAATRPHGRAALSTLQRAVGNRAVTALLAQQQQQPSPPQPHAHDGACGHRTPVQRVVKVTPQMYGDGLGGVAGLTRPQFQEYVRIAVFDDLRYAMHLSRDRSDGRGAELMGSLQTAMNTAQTDVPAAVTALTTLVGELNTYLSARPEYEAPGSRAELPLPNRSGRYATTPAAGYVHNKLAASGPEGTPWGDDPTMRTKVAADLGPTLFAAEGSYPDVAPRTARDNLPLKQLTWAQAKAMLPRPLLNLIFDIRYQLEAPADGAVVIDERTDNEKQRRDKSPHAPGTLRSWHQDDSGRLPDTRYDPAAKKKQIDEGVRTEIPANAAALHRDYTTNSQSGAGSSVRNAATAPRGLAEYTGTGSNTEHNTKLVLDYVNKRVYLTVTHYQFWALVAPAAAGGAYEFWESGSQNLEEATGRLRHDRPGREAKMLSPWLEILTS